MGVGHRSHSDLHDKLRDGDGALQRVQGVRPRSGRPDHGAGPVASALRDELHGRREGSPGLLRRWNLRRLAWVSTELSVTLRAKLP